MRSYSRLGSFLWSPTLRDMDLWDHGKLYTRQFLAPESPAVYRSLHEFTPYFYSEKWDAQDFPSLWKAVFEALYGAWPYVDLGVLIFAALGLLVVHVGGHRVRLVPSSLVPMVTALGLLYLADAIMYSVFGVFFFRRMMLASAPMALLVFGIILGGALRRRPGGARLEHEAPDARVAGSKALVDDEVRPDRH